MKGIIKFLISSYNCINLFFISQAKEGSILALVQKGYTTCVQWYQKVKHPKVARAIRDCEKKEEIFVYFSFLPDILFSQNLRSK